MGEVRLEPERKVVVVLLSGGQDSTTVLFAAVHAPGVKLVCPVTLDYGQRHATEIQAAREVVQLARAAGQALDPPVHVDDPRVVQVPLRQTGTLTHLIEQPSWMEPFDQELFRTSGRTGLPASWVPGRNALLLTLAAAVAFGEGAHEIWGGMCETDYSGYPDCRRVFLDAMQVALTLGVGQTIPGRPMDAGAEWMPPEPTPWRIEIVTPLMWLDKAATVRMAESLPGCLAAIARTVTCYRGLRPGCGRCPACVLRAAGFGQAGIPDPAQA